MIAKLTLTAFLLFVVNQPQVNATRLVNLTTDNFATLRGEVAPVKIAQLMNELMNKTSTELFIFLDTPGGDVFAGLELVNYIKTLESLNRTVSCIANKAYSMGFVILQYCTNRYITPHAKVMQHQMALGGVGGSLFNINSYMRFINSLEAQTGLDQATRINMSYDKFITAVRDDWWIYGRDIIHHNVADEVVNVVCGFTPVQIQEKIITMFGKIKVVYSSCPIIGFPLSIEFGNNVTEVEAKQVEEQLLSDNYIPMEYPASFKHNYLSKY